MNVTKNGVTHGIDEVHFHCPCGCEFSETRENIKFSPVEQGGYSFTVYACCECPECKSYVSKVIQRGLARIKNCYI